ncbi:MAG: hypothetical protein HUK20_06035 [Fibrobacter sp.]|nr:hypothetical protein [Fibrobacter sp.]
MLLIVIFTNSLTSFIAKDAAEKYYGAGFVRTDFRSSPALVLGCVDRKDAEDNFAMIKEAYKLRTGHDLVNAAPIYQEL